MTDRLTPTTTHETLDHQGLLADAHGPGVYALEAAVPDSVEAVHRAWHDHGDPPPDWMLTRLAQAERVAYVGASNRSVYDRLQDHAEGEVRKATLLEVFDPVGVIGVWPAEGEDPVGIEERPRAMLLAQEGWVAWTDGTVIG